jgi:hypothetical protein
MTHIRRWVVVSVSILAVVPSLLAQSVPSRPQRPDFENFRKRLAVRKGAQPAETVAAPAQPVVPPTMAQLPATPPKVTYQNGALFINAENSTLGDILREVQKHTGATIDVPPNASERVVARLGPAPPRDVLASLLNGSSFNYVMVGSATDPNALATVMLTMKTGGGVMPQPTQTAEVYQPPPVRTGFVPPPIPAQPAVTSGDEKDEEDTDEADDSADQDQPAGQPGQANANAPAPTPDPQQPNAGPKSPQQIMEMLRQNRQQQKTDNPEDPPEQ